MINQLPEADIHLMHVDFTLMQGSYAKFLPAKNKEHIIYFTSHSIFPWLQIFTVCGGVETGGKTRIDSIVQGVAMVYISGKQHESYQIRNKLFLALQNCMAFSICRNEFLSYKKSAKSCCFSLVKSLDLSLSPNGSTPSKQNPAAGSY